MKIEKGIYTDTSETDQPQGTYRYAKNIVDSNTLAAKENEDGFTDLETLTPYAFIGAIPIDNESTVVFSTDNTNSEIGLVDLAAGTYTAIYNDPLLNFSTSKPIKGEYRKGVTGGRAVAWTDNLNSPRILDIDDVSSIDSIQDLNVFQDVNNPSLASGAINDFGGSLQTGAIIPITRYKNVDGSETSWFVHDKVFYINDDSKSLAFNDDDGSEPGKLTGKSISFNLLGVDTRYSIIEIGYIKVINNITTAVSAFTRSTSASISIAITGSESTTDVSLDEVLTSNTSYSTAAAITQLSGQLYLGNLTAEPIPELQQTALKIRLNYNHELKEIISNTGSHKDVLPPTFMPGEAYAFYFGVELVSGGWAFYHIPGRPPVTNDKDFVNDVFLGLDYYYYQVSTTVEKMGAGATTNFGYWENQNELYPNDPMYDATSIGGPDLRGLAVRHHRFPTAAYIEEQYYPGDANYGITKLAYFNVQASNVSIPAGLEPKIKRWKIFFAKKTNLNSLVIGSDLYQAGIPPANDPTLRWGTGGNWGIDATPGGSDNWDDFDDPIFDNLRGHSLDFLYNPPSAAPAYASFAYLLKRNNINAQYTGFRTPGGRLTVTGENRGTCASVVVDFTVPTQTVKTTSNFRKRLDNFTYLPQNALNGKFKSQYNEPSYVADIYNPSTDFNTLTKLQLLTRSTGTDGHDEQFERVSGGTTDIGEATYYMQYYRLLTNVHVSFTQQDLVPMIGYAAPNVGSQIFEGGDTFMAYMSYLATGPLNSNPDSTLGTPHIEGVRAWKAYIGYSRYNWNYRYETQGNISTFYHGKTDVRTLFTPYVTQSSDHSYTTLVRTDQSLNVFQYDTSMNFMNTLQVGIILSPNLVQATEFPNTIIWSPTQSEESKEFSWRSFPAGNRYTITKNKGDLVNLQGMKNKELIMHTQYAIFRTRTDADVQADGENIFFKSANLFDLPPEELVPTTSGYGGTQNKFACVLTKVGYVFPDDLQGKIFIYDGVNLNEISSNGNRIFFRDFMKMGIANQDNPFNGTGYTCAYDERYNRVVISKKNGDESWTASYNPAKTTWISFHDYTPDYLFNTLGGSIYSTKGNAFFRNNGGAKGVYYDSGTIYPSLIDITFNPQAPGVGDKPDILFKAINWVTEIYANTYNLGQPSSDLDYMNTCTHLTVRSADHATGKIKLVPLINIDDFQVSNVRNINRTWSFDMLRDITSAQGFLLGFYSNYNLDPTKLNINTNWFDQRQFIDKYLTCRFEYDNQTNSRFFLLQADANYQYVQR